MIIGDIYISSAGFTRQYRLMGPLVVAGGEPKWDTIDRAVRPPVSTWNGRELFVIEMPIMIDGWSSGENVAPRINWLRRLMTAPNDGGLSHAPTVQVDGVGILEIPHAVVRDMDFVVASVEIDDSSIIRDERLGTLYRVAATVTLQEFIPAPVIEINTTFTKAAAAGRAVRVKVQKTDNFTTVSTRHTVNKAYRKKVKAYFVRKCGNSVVKLRALSGQTFMVKV